MNLGIAIAIASEAFKNKTDKGGKPYILHCIRVMQGVQYLGVDAMCAGVLHDLIEDTDEKSAINYTKETLEGLGFNSIVVEAVILLTHDKKNISYENYIRRLSHNKLTTAVKLSDLKDNSNITRLKGLTKKDFDRMEKYHTSYTYLSKC